ncbi:MAG: peptide chain release factor aRF-1 [Nitrososphaeria archaeon]
MSEVTKKSSVERYKLKKLVLELSKKSGRGTELVSLYIPPGKPIHEVINSLRDEWGTASNIKSDTTRTHVQDALVKTMQRLKLYKKIPENGLAIFCGALPTNGPGSEIIFLYEVVPIRPIQNYLYRCDDHFHVEILQDMLKEEVTIGLLTIDTSEAGLGLLSGDRIEISEVLTSGISGKHRSGGQSARRFERLREAEVNDFFHRIARHAAKIFLEENKISKLIISGPGPTKEDFLKGEYLHYQLKAKVVAVIDTSYAGEEGIRETVMKSEKILEDIRMVEEIKLVQHFLREVSKEDGLAAYGIELVENSLKQGNADTVIIVEDLNLIRLKVKCKFCKNETVNYITLDEYIKRKQEILSTACINCQKLDYELEEEDYINYIAEQADLVGSKVEVISSKTEAGLMLKNFGGIGVLLRYKVRGK